MTTSLMMKLFCCCTALVWVHISIVMGTYQYAKYTNMGTYFCANLWVHISRLLICTHIIIKTTTKHYQFFKGGFSYE